MDLMMWVAQAEYGGWFRPYALFLTVGFLAVIIAAYIKFKIHKVPTKALDIGVFIVIPVAVFGASFFGKLDPLHPIFFFELFAFWEPGLSIHGGLIFGIIAGFFWFRYCANKNHVSIWVYADLILPNILLGQVIGRWGNFFNHELFGHQLTSHASLNWLPSFISDNCFKWYTPNELPNDFTPDSAMGINGDPVRVLGEGASNINMDHILWFQPIYLYESFADFILWIILLFAIPGFCRFLNWKRQREFHNEFSNVNWWKQHYYCYDPDPLAVKEASEVYNLEKVYQKDVKKVKRIRRFKIWCNWKKKRLLQLWRQDRRKLERLENPQQISVLRCGVTGSLYIFGYDFIRFFLELQRQPGDLFLINMTALDYIFLWLFIMLGAGMAIYAQFLAPYRWRQGGWLYEKQY